MHMPYKYRSILLTATASALALAIPFVAHAQTAGAAAETDEIIVTANKRSENIQIVAQAVTAVSGELLSDTQVKSLTDIGGYVPGLQIDSAGTPGQTMISIRGVAPVGPGATVATYIDDTPVGSSSAHAGAVSFMLDLLPYDLDRLEVLRGPQGTLYGASSMGGLIKYVLSEPSLSKFRAQFGVGGSTMAHSDGIGRGARGLISGPIIDGKLGATASLAVEHTPGYIDNPLLGTKDQNGYNQINGRIGLLWEPADNLKIKFNALYNRIRSKGNANVPLDPATLRPLVGKWADNNQRPQPFESKIQYYSGMINYDVAGAEFVSATSYSDTRTHQAIDETYIFGIAYPLLGFPAGTSQSHYRLHLKKFTQEARLQSSPGAKLEWLIGGFFTNEKATNFQRPDALAADGTPLPFDPIFDAALPSSYTEYAAFGDLTLHLNDQIEIAGGVRYSKNHQKFSEIATSALIGDQLLLDQKSRDSVTTYSASAKYRFTDKIMAYARVASGYQPGGPNIALFGAPPTFKPDTLTNYEAGLKTQFLDDRVLLDLAAFHIDWKDIQLIASNGGISFVANGGKAKSEGFEGNVTLRPVEGLQFDGTIAYVHAVLTQDAPPIDGLKGDHLPYIPSWSGSVRASYTHPVSSEWDASLGAGLRLVGKRISQVNSSPLSFPLGGYAALDVNASLSNDRYTVRLFAKNLTDRHAYLSYNVLQNGLTNAVSQISSTVLQPRVIGVAFDAKF
ncbi:TonB-dependent receptor [Sphingobium sp.]|uniref:TonB-dependent receptor n=1 Tax=Sphingobium sp. TaxID=1912891 RepID=UPI0028BE695D|nr:TonB-dependent receptor [Sphingobium sp.]